MGGGISRGWINLSCGDNIEFDRFYDKDENYILLPNKEEFPTNKYTINIWDAKSPEENMLLENYTFYFEFGQIKEDGSGIFKYPSFDADSIIYFMQQYSPDSITIIGETPQELDDLLITEPELGAGLQVEQLQRINLENYLSYWEIYEEVVYVEDNYELALLASTYASLINSPLIIQGTELDADKNFEGKRVICVGPVSRSCDATYTLEELQQSYVDLTNTDKIILINPQDLNIKVEEEFQPEKSTNPIYEIYSKTSLASSILASAKHEIIIPIKNNSVIEIDNALERGAERFDIGKGFLTVFGTSDHIESLVETTIEYLSGNCTYNGYADIVKYSVLNEEEDKIFDLAPGRIFGLTISDISSYVNRVLFYNKLPKSNSVVSLSSETSIANAEAYQKLFQSLGYNSSKVISYDSCCPRPSPEDYADKFFIYFEDHGNHDRLGISSRDWPLLKNTFILGTGCSTCIYRDYKKPFLMCSQAIRKGAIGYFGMVEGGGNPNLQYRTSNLFTNKTLGEAYLATISPELFEAFGLIGDPTLRLDPPHSFPHSEINKIEEDHYEINLKVAKIPVNFSYIERLFTGETELNIDTNTLIFSSSSRGNDIKISFNQVYTNMILYENGTWHIYPEDRWQHFKIYIRVGPVQSKKNYSSIEVSGNFINYCREIWDCEYPYTCDYCAGLRSEEWIEGRKYLWIYLGQADSFELPFNVPDTGELFETIKFEIRTI